MIAYLPGNEALARQLDPDARPVWLHAFPDGETRVTVPTPTPEAVDLVCTLDRPDPKLVPLGLAAAALRALGARRVRLCAPYLCYLRQDRRFQPGEAVSAGIVGGWLGSWFDAVYTVEPHLHRLPTLDAAVPGGVAVPAAPALAAWVRAQVDRPLIIGPDAESEPWARAVAEGAGAPYTVLTKERRGDRDVSVSVPDLHRWPDRVPVLVDDIVSTGRTLAAVARHLHAAGAPPPVAVVVHALFAPGAPEALAEAGITRLVSTDTVPHPSNTIPVAPLLAAALGATRR